MKHRNPPWPSGRPLRRDPSGQCWLLALPAPGGGGWRYATRSWRGLWVSGPAGP